MRLVSTDVVVIGGGVIGAAVAFSLASEGVGVTLVERRGIGREASGANVGLVTLFSAHSLEEPDPGPVYALTRASVDTYATLAEDVGVDVEYERIGGLFVAETEERLAVLRRAYEGYRRHGVPVEWLDPAGVRQCEPAFVNDRVRGGVFCPLNGQCNPLAVTRAFAHGARARGATLLIGVDARGIKVSGGRVVAVETTEGEIPCGHVVNAAGAWAGDIGARVGVTIPVAPARGQMVLTAPAPRFINHVIGGSEPSARQTLRGNVMIGSSIEDAGFDKGVTHATVDEFVKGAVAHFPRVAELQVIRTWAGLRPATPDHKPIIEMVDEPRGLCLAVGHSRRGRCYAPATGRAVADLITGRPPFLDLAAFRLNRFPDLHRAAALSSGARDA